MGIRCGEAFAVDAEAAFEQFGGTRELFFDAREVQSLEKHPAAGLFHDALQRIVLVRVLGDLKQPRCEARLQLAPMRLDVGSDHKDRGRHIDRTVDLHDLCQKARRGVLRHGPSDPFLAGYASGNPFHVIADNQG